jgi:hypothetical protein
MGRGTIIELDYYLHRHALGANAFLIQQHQKLIVVPNTWLIFLVQLYLGPLACCQIPMHLKACRATSLLSDFFASLSLGKISSLLTHCPYMNSFSSSSDNTPLGKSSESFPTVMRFCNGFVPCLTTSHLL